MYKLKRYYSRGSTPPRFAKATEPTFQTTNRMATELGLMQNRTKVTVIHELPLHRYRLFSNILNAYEATFQASHSMTFLEQYGKKYDVRSRVYR